MNLGMQRTSALTSFMAFAGNIYSSTKNFVGGEMQLIIKAASDYKTFNLANLTAASRPAGVAACPHLRLAQWRDVHLRTPPPGR